MNTDDLRAVLLDRAELIDTNSDPRTDEVLGRVRVQRRRRTAGAVMGAACLVLAMVGGGALIARQPSDEPRPLGPDNSKTPDADPNAQAPARKLVWTDEYWATKSFHYGDQVVDISPQVAKLNRKAQAGRTWVTLDATDHGVGFHASDGRVWFADGSSVVQIGDLGAGPYDWYAGGLESGSSGSLLAWIASTSRNEARVDSVLNVYDTELRRIVARQSVPECNQRAGCKLGPVVGEDHVYWTVGDRESIDFGTYDGRLMRLDLASGAQSEVSRKDLAADLAGRPRALVVGDSVQSGEVTNGLNEQRFEVRGDRLVPTLGTESRDVFKTTHAFDTATGKELRFRAPDGDEGSVEFIMFEWVDDDQIAMMRDGARLNNGAEGYGDIIVCRISSGECSLVVEGPGDTGFPRIVSHIAYAG